MVDDLKADSANYERSIASGATRGSPYLEEPAFGYKPNKVIGSYADSVVHQSRQHWGPSAGAGQSAAPASAQTSYGAQPYAASSTSYSEPPQQQQQPQYQQQQPSYTQGSGYSTQQQYSQHQNAYGTQSVSSTPSVASGGSSASPINYSHYTTDRVAQSNQGGYSNTGSTATYPPNSSVPRASQQHGYQTSGQQYAQSGAQRYFGSLRPAFLVYN
jgi:hypothetical protein